MNNNRRLELCVPYLTKNSCEGGCDRLHLCRAFILGDNCTRRNCRLSHDVQSSHNYLLEGMFPTLDFSDLLDIRDYLLSNRTICTIPPVCKSYSQTGTCTFTEQGKGCFHLHICLKYLASQCFDPACSLSHDIFIDNNQNNLNDYGIDTSDVSISTSELRIWYQRLGVFRREGLEKNMHNSTDRSSSEHRSGEVRGGGRGQYRGRGRGHDRGRGNDRGLGYHRGRRGGGGARGRGYYGSENGDYQESHNSDDLQFASSAQNRHATPGGTRGGFQGSRRSSGGSSKDDQDHNRNRTEFVPEICMYYLDDKCTSSCTKIHDHHKLPYSWQHKLVDTERWRFFDLNSIMMLENAYTVAGNSTCDVRSRLGDTRHAIWTIRFDTMTAGMSDVVQACNIRRISTCNSVQSKNRHATTWKWYKEINDNCEELALDKSQEEIEKVYIRSPTGAYKYTLGGVSYNLRFSNMAVFGSDGQFLFDVIRRPVMKDLSTQSDINTSAKKGLRNARSSRSTNAEESICIAFLMKSCTHGSKCADIHVFDKEYKWQYKLPTDDKWASFNGDESSVIEQKYCVVNNDSCAIKISLNKNEVSVLVSFANMSMDLSGSFYTIRRLSTLSALDPALKSLASEAVKYATKWRWYRREDSEWVEYGEDDLIKSSRLEDKYLSCNGRGTLDFVTEQGDIEINYHTMKHKCSTGAGNKLYDVKRRPLAEDVKNKSDASLPTICANFLAKSCKIKKCKGSHTDQPFLWQHKIESNVWLPFEQSVNCVIENAFCKPGNLTVSVILEPGSPRWNVHLNSFRILSPTGSASVIRRLSTPNNTPDKSKDDKMKKYLSQWIWYQSSDKMQWDVARINTNTKASDMIEEKYQNNVHGEMYYFRDGVLYKIDFDKMAIVDEHDAIQFYLCRRPQLNIITKEPVAVIQSDEICLEFLSSKCVKNRNCTKQHCIKPYQWQYRCVSNSDWTSFDATCNDQLEQCFCDVHTPPTKQMLTFNDRNKSMSLKFDVSYSNMVARSSATSLTLKRLSTPSSMASKTADPNLTVWAWYWEENNHVWVEYTGSLSSDTLEKHYIANPKAVLKFSAGQQNYKMDLAKMQQSNVVYNTVRPMMRRPKLQSLTQAGIKVQLPTTWELKAAPLQKETNYELHVVPKNSREYRNIEHQFSMTLRGTICGITRIQNITLWDNFARKRGQITQLHDRAPEEKVLFHGTKDQFVDVICKNGFDWRIAGISSGTAYGKGSYFARDASYSYRYTDSNCLFAVQVLTGDVALGDSSMVRPPPRDPSKPYENFYDACVDNVQNPSIFVVFDSHQAYPAYLIKYM